MATEGKPGARIGRTRQFMPGELLVHIWNPLGWLEGTNWWVTAGVGMAALSEDIGDVGWRRSGTADLWQIRFMIVSTGGT